MPNQSLFPTFVLQVRRGRPQLLQLLLAVPKHCLDSGGLQLPEQRGLHPLLHPAEDEEGVKIYHTGPTHRKAAVLHGGPTAGGRTQQLKKHL